MFKMLRKAWERFWNHYGKTLIYALTVLTVILSVIGSYQYYSSCNYTKVVEERLLSSVVYSTLKLYLFSPTVGTGVKTPLCYEIAKWMAPLCTAYWAFRAVESLFWHGIGVVKRRLGRKKQIIIFGHNENSLTLIDNIYHENLDHKDPEKDVLVVLVTEKTLEKEALLKLERKNAVVYQMDFLNDKNLKMLDDFKKLRLWNASEIVLFYEDATLNFTIFTRLMKMIQITRQEHWKAFGDREIICAFQCQDNAVKKVVTAYYSSPQILAEEWDGDFDFHSGEERLKLLNPFNLKLFSLPELAAEEALISTPLFGNCLPPPRTSSEGDTDFSEYMKQVKNPHVLIAGFGPFGQTFFEKVLLMGTFSDRSEVSGYTKTRITIIDKQADRYKDLLYTRYPRLDKICAVRFLNMDICGKDLEEKLDLLPMFTYAAVCFSDQTTSMVAMMQLVKYSFIRAKGVSIPIVTRMETDGAMVRYISGMTADIRGRKRAGKKSLPGGVIGEYQHVVSFGSRKKLLTRKNLINPEMEKQAERFHRTYEKQAACMDPKKASVKPWKSLDFERKQSNRVLCLNKPYFQELVRHLNVTLPEEASILTKDVDESRFLEALSPGSILDVLAGLEHRRWCNFCYTYGYVGRDGGKTRVYERLMDKGKTYYGQVHTCLADDWDTMKEDEELRKTIRFDLCSIYRYLDCEEKPVKD